MRRFWLGCLIVCSGGAQADDGAGCLIQAARDQVGVTVAYDPAYRRLAYPGGDPPADRGVCTDVIIRALRGLDLDLQAAVHEDMAQAAARYPNLWSQSGRDRNIDHRRVPNLERYFERRGWRLAATEKVAPGDILSYRLANGAPHIGLVSDRRGASGDWLLIHNIGQGTQEEDVLQAYARHGHFRPRWAEPVACERGSRAAHALPRS